jgi:hypothetical protein
MEQFHQILSMLLGIISSRFSRIFFFLHILYWATLHRGRATPHPTEPCRILGTKLRCTQLSNAAYNWATANRDNRATPHPTEPCQRDFGQTNEQQPTSTSGHNQWVAWGGRFRPNQFKNTFSPPATMECRLCLSTLGIGWSGRRYSSQW